jgi:hypothetical protein
MVQVLEQNTLTTTATNNPNSQLTDPTPVAYFYKSKQTGNWGDASSWLSSSDDITYIDALQHLQIQIMQLVF